MRNVTNQTTSAIAARLMAEGFQVVDAQTVRRNIPRDKALRLLEGDESVRQGLLNDEFSTRSSSPPSAEGKGVPSEVTS